MKAHTTALATVTALVLLSGTTQAQWVNRPTPGIPRLPDGKPNLSAPVPPRLPDGHPDLSGIWDVGNMTYFHDLASGPHTLAQSEKTIFVNNGVLVIDNVSGSPKVLFGTTTEFDTILNQLYQVTEITDYVAQTLRGLLDPIFIGQKLLANTPSQVETVTGAILTTIEASNIIESFTQPSATVNPTQPTQILLQVGIQPVLELDTILITLGLNLV